MMPENSSDAEKIQNYIPNPITQYVAYQEPGSPPPAPPRGGYHGMIRRKMLIVRKKTSAMFQTENSLPAIPDSTRW